MDKPAPTQQSPATAVRLNRIVKSYQGLQVLKSISLEVRRGEFFSLLGPSGCGKTTLLRVIAGLAEIDSGVVEIMDRDVTFVEPSKRNIGMVFQDYALFPHMTVRQNVGFGLKMRRIPRAEARQRITEALELVELGAVGDRRPSQLSGGQQQRVALARAIVVKPELLLLDEPLSNLDAILRKSMQIELRNLQRRVGITTIYVTHDQEEALTLSDRIAVIDSGRISQCAAPVDIYRRPANAFVASFIGKVNILSGCILQTAGTRQFTMDGGVSFVLPEGINPGACSGLAHVAIRPEAIQLSGTGEKGDPNQIGFLGQIHDVVYGGAITQYLVHLAAGTKLSVEEQNAAGTPRFVVGQKVQLTLHPAGIWVFYE